MGRINHSYIFYGPSGTGKTTLARIFGSALNCRVSTLVCSECGEPQFQCPSGIVCANGHGDAPGINGAIEKPCASCDACRDIIECRSQYVVEIDAATDRSVELVEELQRVIQQAVPDNSYRVIVLDEAHQFTPKAWSAFLKTIEEPPPRNIFIFATTVLDKIPETIRTRSLEFTFASLTDAEVIESLVRAGSGPTVAKIIAKAADGCARTAMHMLDRVELLLEAASQVGEEVDLSEIEQLVGGVDSDSAKRLADALISRDFTYFIEIIDHVTQNGLTYGEIATAILKIGRDLLAVKLGWDGETASGLEAASIRKNIGDVDEDYLEKVFRVFADLVNSRLMGTRDGLEVAYVKLIHG